MIWWRRRSRLRSAVSTFLLCVAVLVPACTSRSAQPFRPSDRHQPVVRWPTASGPCSATTNDHFPKNTGLDDVVVTGRCSAWAVGTFPADTAATAALIEHWDGSSWRRVHAPGPQTNTRLFALAAARPNDVWAVGIQHDATERHARTLIDHWNGKKWATVTSPKPKAPFLTEILDSVSASSPTNVWAAGYYLPVGGHYRTLIEHWDGRSWQILPSPNVVGAQKGSTLNDISWAPHGQAWAVGFSSLGPKTWSLIEHWDGRRWRIVRSPEPRQSGLESVSGASTASTWAVGWVHIDATTNKAEVMRWNGRAWDVVPSPSPANQISELTDVTSASGRALAVGFSQSHSNSDTKPLAVLWTGTRWALTRLPIASSASSSIEVGSASGLEFGLPWVVGWTYLSGRTRAFAIRP